MTAGTPRTPVSTLYSASMDSELERRLANFLYQREVPGGNCVLLNAQGGVVVVSGVLPTRRAKWLCIECCRRVAGVIRIIDEVTVTRVITELPKSGQMAAVPKSRQQNRRHTSDCHNDWSFNPVTAREHATPGTPLSDMRPARCGRFVFPQHDRRTAKSLFSGVLGRMQ